jgi:putative RNA 2'-phosphotransferase
MKRDDVRLSKAISFALRHQPWVFELELDADGWVGVEQLLTALRNDRPQWQSLNQADIERVIMSSDKQRFEIQNDRIRAFYGHSIPGKLKKIAAPPPAMLYHGTTSAVIDVIMRDGLKPMSRQYVHLSLDTATAIDVAKRKNGHIIILQVDAHTAHQNKVKFYEGNQSVWLADTVPAAYLATTR